MPDKIGVYESTSVKVELDGKTYSDSLREGIYFCQSNNVAIDNMKDVVSFILSKLGNKNLYAFPDSATCRIVREINYFDIKAKCVRGTK